MPGECSRRFPLLPKDLAEATKTLTKTVLITGASSGIGKETAKLFRDKGWNVVATMRKVEDGKAFQGDDGFLVTRLDLLDADSIDAAVGAGVAKFGAIDVLVNNAGYGAYGPLEGTPMEKLRRQMEVNFFGLVATMQAVLPTMRAAKSGTIVNISSVGGRMCYPLGALYHGSKWAVEGLTEAVSYELLALGIRVKLVEPGGVKTNFSGRSFDFSNDESLEEYQPMVQALLAGMETMDTSGHQAPEDVAEVIFSAATDDSPRLRYVSGQGAQELLKSRYPGDEEAFLADMRKRLGM